MNYTWQNTGIGVIDNLGKQLERVLRGMHQGSIESKHRVKSAGLRFIRFSGLNFGLQKLQNMQDKHLEAYVAYLKDKGCSPKYIKTELSCLRTLHSNINDPRHELTHAQVHNRKMGLGSTPDGHADRSWTEREFYQIKDRAIEDGKEEIANVLVICRALGLRLDEACTLRRSDLESSLRTGSLSLINTKGGRPRTIVINKQAEQLFRRMLPNIQRGQYAFLPVDTKIHVFEDAVGHYIRKIRKEVQDNDRQKTAHNLSPTDRGALTVHGLRHSALSDVFDRELSQHNNVDTALRNTAKYAGHGRKAVSLIYVHNIKGGNKHE